MPCNEGEAQTLFIPNTGSFHLRVYRGREIVEFGDLQIEITSSTLKIFPPGKQLLFPLGEHYPHAALDWYRRNFEGGQFCS